MKKIFSLLCLIIVVSTAPVLASISYRLEDFEKKYCNSAIGVLAYKGQTYYRASFSPDFYLGPIDLGVDFNLFVPADSKNIVPVNQFPWFSFRKLAYEYNDEETTFGFRWGRLTNVEYDYGLLMNGYDTGSAGSTVFDMAKGGAEVYLNKDFFNIRGMFTGSGIQAIHADYTISQNLAFGLPLLIGGMYIQDSVGVFDTDDTSIKLRNPQKAYAATLSVPIIKRFLNAYTEYGVLLSHGTGISFGVGGKWQKMLTYRLEYRNLSEGFVPGYFNTTYQASTFDFTKNALKSHTDGMVAALGAYLIEDYVKTDLMFELYSNNNPVFSWALGWSKIGPTSGVVNFIKSFQDSNAGIINANIAYEQLPLIPFNCDAVIFINRVYKNPNNLNDYDQTIGFGIRPNLTKIFNLPFIK